MPNDPSASSPASPFDYWVDSAGKRIGDMTYAELEAAIRKNEAIAGRVFVASRRRLSSEPDQPRKSRARGTRNCGRPRRGRPS